MAYWTVFGIHRRPTVVTILVASAAFVTWFGMENDRARIDDPAGALRWYASSPGAERGFCTHCGSSLFFRSEHWPGELHIALANLEGEADSAPTEPATSAA